MSNSTQAVPWNAKHGLVGALGLILASLTMNQGLRFAYASIPAFTAWGKSNGSFLNAFLPNLQGLLWILVAYLSARTASIRDFIRGTALDRRPTYAGWALTWGAIVLGVVELCLVSSGQADENKVGASKYAAGEATWTFYAINLVILTPFFEETVTRGFLYSAFRSTFSVPPSVLATLCVTVYFHWGMVHDPFAMLILLVGGIVLCLIREHTGNTWNCVLFHSAFNATVIRQWPVVIVGMLLAFFACSGRTRDTKEA